MAERRAMKARLTPTYFAGLTGLLYANWVTWTFVGAAFGGAIANPEAYGFDFAFTAIFIGLLTGFWRGSATAWVLAASSTASVATEFAVEGPWYIMAGGLAGVVVAILIWRPLSKTSEKCAT